VTVKTPPANAAALASAEGAVKVQTGVAGQVKPVKVTAIFPAAVMAEAAVNVTETVTAVEAATLLDKVTAALVRRVAVKLMVGRVADEVVSISASAPVVVLMAMLDLAAWAAGVVTPVHVKVTVPAARALAERTTVKRLAAKAEEAGSAVPAGAVNLQVLAPKVKPVKPTVIFPEAGIADTEVNEMVAVAAAVAARVVDKVTAPLVSTPTTPTRVPVTEASISASAVVRVLTTTSVLASWAAGRVAPVQVKVTTPAATAAAERVTVKVGATKTEEVGSAVPAGAVNLQTGVAGQTKPVKVVKIFPDAGS